MTYTVIWLREEEDRLLEFWMNASDRAAITSAAHQLDSHLKRQPRSQAVEITPRVYELKAPPLAVAYLIKEDDRIVKVIGVRLLPDAPSEDAG